MSASTRLVSRETYEAAHALAVELDDPRAQVEALLPTRWFRDYWTDYRDTATANIREVVRLANQIDDERLAIEVEMAGLELADERRRDRDAGAPGRTDQRRCATPCA